jgi:PAS domain S-box-containing protein
MTIHPDNLHQSSASGNLVNQCSRMLSQFSYQFNLYIWALFVTGLIALCTAILSWRQRAKAGALPLSLMLVAVAIWDIGSALEFAATTIPGKVYWVRLAFVGVAFTPVFLFLAALQFAGSAKRLRRSALILLGIIPLVTIVAVFTNEWHHLIWVSVSLDPDVSKNAHYYQHGLWFWVQIVYAYGLWITAAILLGHLSIRRKALFRSQAIGGLLALLPPAAVNLLYLFKINPVSGLDFTPLAFALTGLLLAFNVVRFRFLNLVPIARDKLIEDMRDGMLVLDIENRILDINPALQRLVGVSYQEAVGHPVAAIFSQWSEAVSQFKETSDTLAEIHVRDIGHLELRISPLRDTQGQLLGRLILVQDITARKEAQLQLQQTHARLEQRVSEQTADLVEANRRLSQEVLERKRAEAGVRTLNLKLEQRVADRTRELSALYEVSAVANCSYNLETLVAEALARTITAMRSDGGAIYLLDQTSHKFQPPTLRLSAHQGLSPEVWQQLDLLWMEQGLLSQWSQHLEPVLIPDLRAYPVTSPAFSQVEHSALLLAPLRAGQQPVGLLLQLRKLGDNYSREEIALLAAIADQVSNGVESDRLRQLSLQTSVLQERDRLARDLHDSVTQSLYGLVTLTELGKAQLASDLSNALPDTITQIGDTARQALKEMRLFIHQLRPLALEQKGLIGALHQRLAAVEGRSDVKARLLADETIRMSLERQNHLYHIAQEALNNVLRHAQASSVTVYLGREKESIVLEVLDDGRGFDSQDRDRGGMGLNNMQQRAETMRATLTISSIPTQGTRVRVVMEEEA